MTRRAGLAIVAAVIASSAGLAAAQPAVPPASSPALDEAGQLVERVEELYKAGKFQDAIPLAERCAALREQALGPRHPDVAEALNDVAVMYNELGALAKAEQLFTRALRIREAAFGPVHDDVAQSLGNLALLYQDQGAYAKAEPLMVRTLAIREKLPTTTPADLAIAVNALGRLYELRGAYARAEPLYTRALQIREKAFGPMHPSVAGSLNNLGMHYRDRGAYARAEPLLARSLEIYEKALGPTHPNVATAAHNLGLLYASVGADARAEPLLLRAVEIYEKALGPTHPNVATGITMVAVLDMNRGAYARAEPLLVRALAIREQALGAMHPDVATALHYLAELDVRRGAYDVALPRLQRALAIRERALGPNHPVVAQSLDGLGAVYRAQGAYGRAEQLVRRALAIDEKNGAQHPDTARSLVGLAAVYRAQGAYARAEPLLSRAGEIREAELRGELAGRAESRRRALLALLRDETDIAVSLHADALPASPRALELAFTTVLRRKGRILDSLAQTQAALRDRLSPPLRAQLDELAQARGELAELLYRPPGAATATPAAAAARTAAIAALRVRIEALEAGLAAASTEFRAQAAPVTLAQVRKALPRDATLVELVRYRPFDARRPERPWQADRYIAYLLPSHGAPGSVALGDAAPIDAAVDAALAALHGAAPAEATRAALSRLDALVYAPLRARLTGASHVLLAPDGKLDLVPFEALIDADGRYELEHLLVSYVTSGRDLLRLATPHAPRSPAVLVASPDYGPAPAHASPGLPAFSPLAGAAAEAADLRRYFPTEPLTGAAATKRALAGLAGPAMLHVATHGFYARSAPASSPAAPPGPAAPQPGVQRDIVVDLGAQLPPAEDPFDALDQAGLALAGANLGADGIVTAREIAGFDWWGTKLVVLSACETGVGAAPSGDGVHGLRRALVLAGAESQIVSLWSVSDAATRALMAELYGELARGTGRAEALRRAKLRLLRDPAHAHPYAWAAFILAGDWTPLDRAIFERAGSPR